MPLLSLTKRSRLLPRGLLDIPLQLGLFALAYYGYRLVRGVVDGRATVAFENARTIIDLERGVGLFFEPHVQSWSIGAGWPVDFASWMYVNAHFTLTSLVLLYIYFFRNESFYFVRNMFMIAMGIALLGYMTYPTAPPRLMPEWGFQDSVSQFTGIASDSNTVNALFNPFAAVPSMHVGFALMVGVPMALLVKSRVFRVLWISYPIVVSYVVIATGNHFWTDAFLGACTAGLAAYLSSTLMVKARPHAWSFKGRPQPISAEATI